MKKNLRILTSNMIKRLGKSHLAPLVILSILIMSYVLLFSILTIDRHNRFHTLAFDLGIFDQAIWQYSRFTTPFNTVDGVHILGDHFTLINALISPLYWFIDDVRALLVLQALVLAAAAIPLYLIAKHFLKNKWTPLVFCFSYLLFPAIQYTNFEDYHAEVFAPFFILFAFYFIIKGKKWPYLAFFLLSLSVKEEIALTTFLMGVYTFFKYDKKIGVFTSVFSLVWYILVMKVFMPYFSWGVYVHAGQTFGQFGSEPVDVIFGILNPKVLFPVLFNQINATYMWELFYPVGFLVLLSPVILAFSASLWATIIASWPYAHSIHYHYTPPIVPFIYMSLILGIARFQKRKIVMYSLLLILIISAVLSNYHLAPYGASVKNYKETMIKIKNFNIPSEREAQIYHAINLIPKNASVSTSYNLVPQLTHRNKIYMFPNPFNATYWWGNEYGHPPPQEYPDYLLIRKDHIEERNLTLQPLLNNNTYKEIYEAEYLKLYEKQN